MIKAICLAAFVCGAAVSVAVAQPNPEKAIQNAQDQFFDIKKRSVEMERIKRESMRRPAKADYTAAFPAIKKDFEKIQLLNDELQKQFPEPAVREDSAVAKPVAEIRQRAARLLKNLFPEPETPLEEKPEGPPTVVSPAEIGDMLIALDRAIQRFVHNPMFRNLNLVDSADSLRARQDLQRVIDLCEAVRAKSKR